MWPPCPCVVCQVRTLYPHHPQAATPFSCFSFFWGVGSGMLHIMWDLSSPTRDWTHAPCIGSSEPGKSCHTFYPPVAMSSQPQGHGTLVLSTRNLFKTSPTSLLLENAYSSDLSLIVSSSGKPFLLGWAHYLTGHSKTSWSFLVYTLQALSSCLSEHVIMVIITWNLDKLGLCTSWVQGFILSPVSCCVSKDCKGICAW